MKKVQPVSIKVEASLDVTDLDEIESPSDSLPLGMQNNKIESTGKSKMYSGESGKSTESDRTDSPTADPITTAVHSFSGTEFTRKLSKTLIDFEKIPSSVLDAYKLLFEAVDTDKSGSIDKTELKNCFRDIKAEVSIEQIDYLMKLMDTSGDGKVSFDEFAVMMWNVATGTIVLPQFDGKKLTKWGKARNRIFMFLENPSSSNQAQVFSVFMMFIIAINCLTFIIETEPEYHRRPSQFISVMDVLSLIMFTVDYLLRLLTCPDSKLSFIVNG
jgi:hypothetical protein